MSGDINLKKPHPEIFNMALRYLGVKPAEAVFVGDTLEPDVAGSRNAGMNSVHIKRRMITNPNIKPHLLITELKQLMPALGLAELIPIPMEVVENDDAVACQI